MKNLIILLSSIMLVCLAGCEEDKEIKPINPLIENSAETCEILNANVDALHAIIEAMEYNLPVTQNVASNRKNSITFSNNRLAHIYLGTSAYATPFIYAKNENGVYYWCRNDVWLLDTNQNRVEVLKNKLSFKIIDGYWFISFDNKKYENCGEVSGDECIRFFKSFNTKTKAITFTLLNQYIYEYKGYDENDIRFEDPTVEKICIDNWDTNHDMALSYDEAAAVTDIGYKFKDKSIVSFDELQYFVGLQTIGSDAFRGCSSLTSITIPNSVTSIGNFAFYNCSSLTSITIPNSVTSIGSHAFSSCSSLTSITIPNSVTEIELGAFSGCSSLTSINIPNSVTSIGGYAFSDCSSLTSITIPNSVTAIESTAFEGCSSLKEFKGKFASTDSRCLIVNNSLKAFAPAGLTEYTIPNSVTSIGREAFRGCSSLTSITIPNSVISIGWLAFSHCSSLTSITIPNSVTSIGDSAFYGCSSLREFKGKFASTDSRCLIINNALIAFAPAGLTEYTIPDSVTYIGSDAFAYCSSLTSITIPNNVTSIGSSAFEDCSSLTSITIPNSVTYIGRRAFYYCSKLTSITIPNSVTSIGYEAFYNCSKLTSIYCTSSTPPTGSSDMFNSYVTGRKIYVPKAAVDAYKTAAYWSSYANDIVGYDF